ncbi:MAG: hypothetical protein FVQ85_12460 [Planctomycetes bacterium]|nr:hypothetical protein [Planctomycetota bacterium]
MRGIDLRPVPRRYRGISPILALLLIAALFCAVVGVKWYMKANVKDPDLCDDLMAWKEWRLREASEKPIQKPSAEHPVITEGFKFDTNLSEKDGTEPRGELLFFVGPDGGVAGSWHGLYWKTRERNVQIMGGDFAGKAYPAKIYRSETGEEDASKLYLMAKGEFLIQEAYTDKGGIFHRAGDIYVRAWLSRDHVLTGEFTITSDEKYFETFTWNTFRAP